MSMEEMVEAHPLMIRWGSIINKCFTCGKKTSLVIRDSNSPICKDCLNEYVYYKSIGGDT